MPCATEGTQITFARSYAGSTDTVNHSRADLTHLLAENGLHAIAADAELVVSELASNAIEASPGQAYQVAFHIADHEVVVAVTNRTTAILADNAHEGPDDALAPQGRGLMIVHALSKSVEIHQTDDEITVSARLGLPDS